MRRRFYQVTRDAHLYAGLFVSPFIALYALSVFVLVHPGLAPGGSTAGAVRTAPNLAVPPGVEGLSGRARVDAVRSLLDQARVHGEIGYIRYAPKRRVLSIPVTVPGRETTVDLDLATRTATVTERETGFRDALVTLHKSPGPHLADIRMNWVPMRVWRGLSDATVSLILFISVSGVYLWLALRSERRVGLALLIAGSICFFGLAYALAA